VKSSTAAGAIIWRSGNCETSAASLPVIQWIGASRCVPVCSPVVMLFQYQAGPRSSYRLISLRPNRQVWPNCGGNCKIGVSADSGAVRSMTSTAPDATADTSSRNTPMHRGYGSRRDNTRPASRIQCCAYAPQLAWPDWSPRTAAAICPAITAIARWCASASGS